MDTVNLTKIENVVMVVEVLINKYTVVCTNPPYLNKMNGELKSYINKHYKEYSSDLFSVFMYKNFDYCKPNGYSSFMTPFVWMFIKTYEKLREYIIGYKSITTLVQMEYSAFEEATVPICSFVLKNGKEKEKGLFFKLSDFKGGMQVQKQKVFEAISDKECGYFYETSKDNFSKIPSSLIAYWLDINTFKSFELPKISKYVNPRIGLVTGDTNRFLRMWYEPSLEKINFTCENNMQSIESGKKWFPYQKGGPYRKWYGNNEYIINWENDGWEIKNDNFSGKRVKSHNYNGNFAFKEAITWTKISSSRFACRIVFNGFMFDDAGPICSVAKTNATFMLALLNSKVGEFYLSILSPTMNILPGHISAMPIKYESIINNKEILELSNMLIEISKDDWDTFETSWDFKVNPLINRNNTISIAYEDWKRICLGRIKSAKQYEESLNKIFIDIYNLSDSIAPDVKDDEITIRKANLKRDIKSLVSYAVGCMFGRYSLDEEGLVYAGGQWDLSKYSSFIPDKDNCIPIADEEYFEDDIVGRFVEFVKVVYGKETLEENLDFIAKALGGKGDTSREVIRNYFIKDFFKDHVKTYQKRPIYWLYDSGKQNGFKALVYMHRYTADTTGIVRVDYLHKMQKIYLGEINRMQDMIENSTHARDVAQAEKRKEKLIKQLKETKEYDEKIAHIALSRIDIDLDDGVKVNYEKAQTAQDGKKLDIFAKI